MVNLWHTGISSNIMTILKEIVICSFPAKGGLILTNFNGFSTLSGSVLKQKYNKKYSNEERDDKSERY